MRNSTYLFEVLDRSGKMVKRCTYKCNNVRACKHTRGLLKATPDAAVVFGFEKHGHSVLSAYRD